jgi:ankyrin repeat protein
MVPFKASLRISVSRAIRARRKANRRNSVGLTHIREAKEAALRSKSLTALEKALNELNLQVGRSLGNKGWKHATEIVTIGIEDKTFRRLYQAFGGEDTFTLKRLDHAISQIILVKDSEYVEDYLHTSPKASIFLLGINDDSKLALSLAACEKYSDVIKLLLNHRAKPDYRNTNGRTPLIEAALWGQIKNINCLLKHSADRKLRDI